MISCPEIGQLVVVRKRPFEHIATVGGKKAASSYARDMEDYGDDYADDEEYEFQIGEVMGSASQELSPISAEERALLKQLSEYATKGSLRPDCKAQTLINWLRETLKPGGKWNEVRVILCLANCYAGRFYLLYESELSLTF
jgi:hypothetical protein